MAFNFPSSPTSGQIFTDPASGAQYVYKNGVWMQTSAAQITLGATNYNRVVNGAMLISQENGNNSGIVSGFFPADQWSVAFSTTGAISAQRVATAPTPKGTRTRIRYTVTTADTGLSANEFIYFLQPIEGIRVGDLGWGAAGARQVVLRFGFRGPAGTYYAAIRNGAIDRSYVKAFTISAGQNNIDTEQVMVIPGDIAGTWNVDSSVGMYLSVCPASGSAYMAGTVGAWVAGNFFSGSAQSNGLGVIGYAYDIFDVGLYADPSNTGAPPAWVAPDWASELAECMRYWEKSYDYGTAPGVTTSPGVVTWQQSTTSTAHLNSQRPFKVTKRAAPVMTAYNPNTGAANSCRNVSAASDFAVSSFIWTGTTSTGYITTAAGGVADQQYAYHYVANARM